MLSSDLQECPICSMIFPRLEIENHVDECLSNANSHPVEANIHCEFCRQEFPLDKSYFLECDHTCCFPCVRSFLMRNINCNKSSEIVCPNASCKKPFAISDIRNILQNDELVEKYQSNSIQEYFSASSNVIECPECKFKFEKTLNADINQNEVVLGEDGQPISKESLIHRANNRFRLVSSLFLFGLT